MFAIFGNCTDLNPFFLIDYLPSSAKYYIVVRSGEVLHQAVSHRPDPFASFHM